MKKNILIILVIATICMLSTISYASIEYILDKKTYSYTGKDVNVIMNNEQLNFDIKPIISSDRVLLPIRVIVEKNNGTISWDEKTRTVTITTSESKTIKIQIDNNKASVDNQEIVLDVAPCIAYETGKADQGRTMLPLRFIVENMGLNINWNQDTYTATITKKELSKVESVKYTIDGAKTKITIKSNNVIEYKKEDLELPNRLSIDIFNSQFDFEIKDTVINLNNIEKIRYGKYDNYSKIVIDMIGKQTYTISLSSDKKEMNIEFSNQDITINKVASLYSNEIFKLSIDGSNIGKYDIRRITNPEYINLEIYNAKAQSNDVLKNINTSNELIEKIVVENFSNSLSTDNIRIKIYLKDQYQFTFDKTSENAIVTVVKGKYKNIEYSNLNSKYIFNITTLTSSFSKSDLTFKQSRIDNKYVLEIPYSIADIGEGEFKIGDNYLEKVNILKDNVNKKTIITFSDYKACDYILNIDKDIISIQVDKRDLSRGVIVVLDPGHTWSKVGAVINGVNEMDIDVAVADMVEEMLKNTPNVEVYDTHDLPDRSSLYILADFANKIEADFYLSIHANVAALTNGTYLPLVSGTETYYASKTTDLNFGMSSKEFAEIIQKHVVGKIGSIDRGAKQKNEYIITRETKMTSALVEMGFMTNKAELEKLTSPYYQKLYATAIYEGIMEAINKI